jgi:hypothetical protein
MAGFTLAPLSFALPSVQFGCDVVRLIMTGSQCDGRQVLVFGP